MASRKNVASETGHNTPYPELGATVAKFRAKANAAGSLTALPRSERVAYANAIEAAIRTKNNAWWRTGLSLCEAKPFKVGDIAAEHRRALLAYPAKVRAARKPHEWASMYAAAMAEKKARETYGPFLPAKSAFKKYWSESATASVANKAAAAVAAKVSASALAAKRSEAARKANETRKARKLGKAA